MGLEATTNTIKLQSKPTCDKCTTRHHHWCSNKNPKGSSKEHIRVKVKTSQVKKKIKARRWKEVEGKEVEGRGGRGGSRKWVRGTWRCADVWVGVWDDGSGLRSEGGSEGWAGITKVIFPGWYTTTRTTEIREETHRGHPATRGGRGSYHHNATRFSKQERTVKNPAEDENIHWLAFGHLWKGKIKITLWLLIIFFLNLFCKPGNAQHESKEKALSSRWTY